MLVIIVLLVMELFLPVHVPLRDDLVVLVLVLIVVSMQHSAAIRGACGSGACAQKRSARAGCNCTNENDIRSYVGTSN